MKIDDAKKLTANIFQLEQEINRGKWDENTERDRLIEFAESFDKQVKKKTGEEFNEK